MIHDLLVRAGAPTSLEALKLDVDAARKLADARPDLPARAILDAQLGLRPSGRGGRVTIGGVEALLTGPPPERARRVVVALHGRGAEAGSIVRRAVALAGADPETAILGLHTGRNRWYGVKAGDPGAGDDPEVRTAIARVSAVLDALPPGKRVTLLGFSQGSCLALEVAARRPAGIAAIVAPAGARIGLPTEWAPATSAPLQVLIGAATQDPFISPARIVATADSFRAAGATVDVIGDPGDRHDIGTRQRLRARELILGEPAPAGPSGFAGALDSEAIPGALPRRQNSPRHTPFGLHAEQISGTGFTAPRAENRRVWLYRVRPPTDRRAPVPLPQGDFGAAFAGRPPLVELAGFAPLAVPTEPRDFLDGLHTLGGAGHPTDRRGWAVHRYAANRDMERRAFVNADGDLLLVPEHGAITAMTELGPLDAAPGQLLVLPAGIAFAILLHGADARGTVAEAYGGPFRLPERGPAGANGLADPRHFRAPAAWFEDRLQPGYELVSKLGGRLHAASQDYSPFDVAAWHGNHVPFVYDLADFSPLGSVLHDHPDPSIYCVLSAPGLDFILFPSRWEVAQHTFRPPFFHRNVITEVNGVIRTHAPTSSPFQPGAIYVTPSLTPHGPSAALVDHILTQSEEEADRPEPPRAGLWFQLEGALPMSLTPWGEGSRLASWPATWGSHRSRFTRT
jgi:homogentisate 1,2-dioxygenase